MKIVYIAKAIVPSRTANSVHIIKICQAMANLGHDVVLCVIADGGRKEKPANVYEYYAVECNFKIIWVPVFSSRDSRIRYLFSTILSVIPIAQKILSLKPDLVFGRDLLGCTIGAILGKTTIFESHSPLWGSSLESLLFKVLLRLSAFRRMVVISEALRQAYLEQYTGLLALKLMVAHDAAEEVCTDVISNDLGGRLDALKVGYVGHLYKGKGVEVIANIAPKLPNIDFHVIGGLEENISEWKSKIRVNNVFFHGFISQKKLPSYIKALDVCLLPNQLHVSAYGATPDQLNNISNYTSPLKMFEYMAHKKPIIASDLPVLKEVLNDEVSILVSPSDFSSWIEAIKLLEDLCLREELGKRANQLFTSKYTWNIRAKCILAGFS